MPHRGLRQSLGRLRLRVRLSLFGNNQALTTNALYKLYHRRAQKSWLGGADLSPSDVEAAGRFAHDGFLVLHPRVAPDRARRIKETVDALFAEPDRVQPISDGLSRLRDGLEHVPEVTEFLAGPAERTVEAYYRSHFKLYGVYFYRTVPTPTRRQSSFLWHVDNVPAEEIKLMLYLDDTVDETGAFRCKTRSLTGRVKAQGWWQRDASSRFLDVLEDPATTTVFEGPVGTSILFQNGGVAHKATSPLRAHRDVVTFVIVPSDIPWRAHFPRNRHKLSTNTGICLNPYTDRPQSIGYRE